MEQEHVLRIEPTYQLGTWPRHLGSVWSPYLEVLVRLLIVLILLVVCGLAPAYFWGRWLGWTLDGAVVQGDVVRRWIDTDDDGVTTHHYEYVYTVDGRQYRAHDDITAAQFSRGQAFVLYWRAFPQVSRLVEGPTGPIFIPTGMAIPAALAIFGWPVLLGVLYWPIRLGNPTFRRRARAHLGRKRTLRRALLAGQGHIIIGDLLSADISPDDDRFTTTITYQFVSPQTLRPITGRYEKTTARQPTLTIPTTHAGAVRIVYLNDEEYFLI